MGLSTEILVRLANQVGYRAVRPVRADRIESYADKADPETRPVPPNYLGASTFDLYTVCQSAAGKRFIDRVDLGHKCDQPLAGTPNTERNSGGHAPGPMMRGRGDAPQ